jgi:predicted outer membrane protein
MRRREQTGRLVASLVVVFLTIHAIEGESTMDRRHVLSLFAFSTVTPTIALAQYRRRSEERLEEIAERYIEDTLALGGIALATSRLAEERGHFRWVKRFAQYEIEEQESVAGILQSFGGRAPAEAREERRELARDLRELRGERFDEAFLDSQAGGHQRLLRIQNEFMKAGRDEELQAIAKLIRSRVQEHIGLLRVIRDEVRA